MGCAHLFARVGISTERAAIARPAGPVVLLSAPARALMRDLLDRPTLFADAPRIVRRVVAWGSNEAISVPHEAVIVTQADFDAIGYPPSVPSPGDVADIAIHTAAPFPAGEIEHFGWRSAGAVPVSLRFAEDGEACWIEAVRDGWLFLIPAGRQEAWLLCVGASVEMLVGQSRHIAGRLDQLGMASTQFDVSARLLTALQGEDWLACGSAAVGFDPICGDGTAQALREALLASAVIAARRDGGDWAALRAHYESMLIAAMRRHLRLCADFYASGGRSDWWRTQVASLRDGYERCTARLATMPEPRYQLQDFRLIEREPIA